jgi:D-alanyl-lipoteichoic acid acyltransferase DltB (MBOAT superfamily)
MLFNSFAFLLGFLPLAIAIGCAVDAYPRLRMWTLVLLSLAFYSYWDPRFLPLMVASIVLNWAAARWYDATRDRHIITVAIVGNLALLGFLKYTNFLADTFTALGVPLGRLQLTLPLGISFFTFHHVMYLVDLRRGAAPLYALDRYALYICFFPQAIAGPIARWSEVMHQFGARMLAAGWERRWALGVALIVIGLVEKTVLADPLGRLLDPVYTAAAIGPVRDGSAWLAFGFAFQVFFDFAGYSDIAIGLALIFGVVLPQNFNAPFRATSVQDFWQRWHITLMEFLRRYVFLPLAGIRVEGVAGRTIVFFGAMIATMALCGLWHGASWTFVLWGTINGCAIVFATLWRRYLPSPPAAVGWALTAAIFIATSVLFRAQSLGAVWNVFAGLADAPDLGRILRNGTIVIAALCAFLLPASQRCAERLVEQPRMAIAAMLALVCAVVLIELGEKDKYDFIYFQF